MFGLTILGNNSALPAFGRHPTAQALAYEDQIFLIDCGEGTQMQLSTYKIKTSKINHIFISHLHGDHYFGIAGLINSMALMGRRQKLHLYGPAPLKKILDLQFSEAGTQLNFPFEFIPITEKGILFDSSNMTISAFPVNHRIECWGFHFKEKKLPRKLLPEKAKLAGIPPYFFRKLQSGEDFIDETGKIIPNNLVTIPNLPGRTYAYSADTVYDESLCCFFEGVDLLYHESTYLHNLQDRAAERYHSTARQAAEMAAKCKVKKLLLGHFSSKYEEIEPFLEEASAIFPNVELAIEGVTFRIMH